MTKKISKTLAFVLLAVVLSPLSIIYFYHQTETALWLWSWLVLWAWFLFSKKDNVERGFLFIVGCSIIAIYGGYQLSASGKEAKEVIDVFTQIMLLVGGGVGGNFIAHGILNTANENRA